MENTIEHIIAVIEPKHQDETVRNKGRETLVDFIAGSLGSLTLNIIVHYLRRLFSMLRNAISNYGGA